ncbi:hypothetical protein T06_4849 [Trichinella sp. T6]|nr:hypothetical protein T06_4849 [Trichinella sp. T6]
MREIMRKIKRNNYNLVYEGRAHHLKHTNFDKKQWISRVISILISHVDENIRELAGHTVWCMDGTFKIVPEWHHQMFCIHVFKEGKLIPLVYCLTVRRDLPTYHEIFDNLILKVASLGVVLQPQTIICDFETALIPAVQGSFPGVLVQDCYFHFCQVVRRKVADLGLRTRYLHEAEIKTIIKMLLATAFLPLAEVPDAVDLHGRDVTGSVAALFEYFREEWMTRNRMPLWNVYHAEISTNNHLEVWHFIMNRKAGKCHLSFYELLRLLIDEQGSTATLIQLVISGCVTLRITALTAEYDGGTHAIEQFLKAIAYDVPELFIFICIVLHQINSANNHLEGWHNRLNRKAGKSHNGFYELLELLIAEQGVMDTLIQQVLSGNVTVGDLRRVNRVYAQKQRQVAQYTGEYTNGRRTLEQFLEALIMFDKGICVKSCVKLMLFVRVIQIIFFLFLMADVPELHVVNRCGGKSLVYKGRIYKFKRASRQKYWRENIEKVCAKCAVINRGCDCAIWTNLDVTSVIKRNDHMESCPVDEHLAYKMEKRAVLTKRSAEETKPIPAIYDELSPHPPSHQHMAVFLPLNG